MRHEASLLGLFSFSQRDRHFKTVAVKASHSRRTVIVSNSGLPRRYKYEHNEIFSLVTA